MTEHTRLEIENLRSILGDSPRGAYLVDLDRFEENVRSLRDAFNTEHETHLAYSYKTNYAPAICQRADAAGCLAEVVSEMELRLALAIGVDARRIVFNGPAKTTSALTTAFAEGALVHVDNLDEIDRIAQLRAASDSEKCWRVVVRCNPPHDATFGSSRFGLSVENGDFSRGIEKLRSLDGVAIEGLHAHICPSWRSPAAYAALTSHLISVAREHLATSEFQQLNIGGGFYSPMPQEMAQQWDREIPTFQDYGVAVGLSLREAKEAGHVPPLYLEPGISVVADAVTFACHVVATKHVGERNIAIVAGSVYDVKPSKARNNLPLTILHTSETDVSAEATWDITGFTCMEDDVLHRGYRGTVSIGDICLFGNAGAYSNVLRPPFIEPAPGMYTLGKGGDDFGIVRRPSTFVDVFGAYAQEFGD